MKTQGYQFSLLGLLTGLYLTACDVGPSALNSAYKEAAEHMISSSSNSSSSAGNSVVVSGVVAKGVISAGTISAFGFSNGDLITNPLVTTSTNINGAYSVGIQNYTGPLLIRATPGPNTTMVCDLVDGCGTNINFSNALPLTGSAFQLDAVIPRLDDSSSSVQTNISMLTNLAAQSTLENLTSGISNAAITDLATTQLAKVANRFGIQGNINTLPIIDLTDLTSVSNATSTSLQYNLLNSAILGASLKLDSSLNVVSAISQFTTNYLTNGGIADMQTTTSTVPTLADILDNSSKLIDKIVSTDIDNILNLTRTQSVIEAARDAALIGSTTPSNGEASNVNLGSLEKVKAMVAELRKVGNASDEGFTTEQNLIQAIVDSDTSNLLKALSMGAKAMDDAWNAYDANNQTTSYMDNENGITVSIAATETNVTYSIDTDLTILNNNIALALSAVDSNSSTTSETTQTGESGTANIDLSVSGNIESTALTMEIKSGSLTLTNLMGTTTETQTETGVSTAATVDFDRVAINLSALLSQTTSASQNPVNFDGNISFSIDNFAATGTAQQESVSSDDYFDLIANFNADSVKASLSGKFSNTGGDSVSASISLSSKLTAYDPEMEESDSDYLAMSFSTIFGVTSLGEIATPAKIIISGARTGADSTEASVEVRYGAISLRSSPIMDDSSGGSTSMTITDQNGVVMTLTETEDAVSGTIVLDGTQYATIGESVGIIRVSYTDNTNESLW